MTHVQQGFFSLALWCQVAPEKIIWLKNGFKMVKILDEIAGKNSN